MTESGRKQQEMAEKQQDIASNNMKCQETTEIAGNGGKQWLLVRLLVTSEEVYCISEYIFKISVLMLLHYLIFPLTLVNLL